MSGEHELPPGWRVMKHRASGWWHVYTADGDKVEEWATRTRAVESAWEHFGPPRERYLALLDAERRCADLERERDTLKAARDGKYFRDASEADLRAAMSRISYASGIYYQAEYESAPAHPSDVADQIERWIGEMEGLRDQVAAMSDPSAYWGGV